MRRILILFAIIVGGNIFSQHPILYINFVSHNEPYDNLHQAAKFNAMNPKVLQLASIIDAKGASWNLETCEGYPTAALNLQGVNSNVFRTITSAPYNDNIEIDPRPKTTFTASINIADTYRILDTLGCNPTNILGGFVYSTSDQSQQEIDWYKYQDTITGIAYPWKKWKAQLMWGAGSYTPHTNDLNDYGIWKPDTVSYTNTFASFYNHNPDRSVWFISNGCQPLYALDSTENEQTIISDIRSFVANLQNGSLPQNKFYVQTVTINQSHFGPTLFQKITNICDSVNSWGTDKIDWAKLTEKFSLFETWQSSTLQEYSQWLCGQSVGLETESVNQFNFDVFPNPASTQFTIRFSDNNSHEIKLFDLIGNLILKKQIASGELIQLDGYSKGMYLVNCDGVLSRKIVKE